MQATGNNQQKTYSLSIRLHADGFSFYSYSPTEAEAIKTETYHYQNGESHAETLEKALAQSTLTERKSYLGIYCLITGPSIQTPLEAFKKEEANTLFRLTFAQKQVGKIYYNILPHLEIAKIFSVDKELEQMLCRRFPGIRFYHADTMLLEKMLTFDTKDKQRLYVYFHEQEMLVFGYKEQKLHYANSFPADHSDNATYFILSVWKHLAMDTREGECILLGENSIKNECTQTLGKYLHQVKPLTSADIYRRYASARNPQVPFDLLTLLVNVI